MNIFRKIVNFCKELLQGGKFENSCLQAHNKYRAEHGVIALKLDRQLNKSAQRWATTLGKKNTMEHSAAVDYGENLYMCSGYKSVTGDMPVKSWYDEIRDYDFRKAEFSPATGHFTQLIWKKSTKLGVGHVTV